MRCLHLLCAGACAALAAPLWLAPSRLRRLLIPPAAGTGAPDAPARSAVRVAFRLLWVLARLPGRHWRNTCLYRSVAACLVLRHYGVAVHLEIGVARSAELQAHAWVVYPDIDAETEAVGMKRLSFAR